MNHETRIFYMLCICTVLLCGFQPKKPKKPKATKVENAIKLKDTSYSVEWDKTFHDFGEVEEGNRVTTDYILTNTGRAPVKIIQWWGTSGSVTVDHPVDPILPGKIARITVNFNTNGKIGQNTKPFGIVTNGGRYDFHFTCKVIEKKQ